MPAKKLKKLIGEYHKAMDIEDIEVLESLKSSNYKSIN